jgi:hypothetical protein
MALRLMPYYATFYSYKGGVGRTLALVNVAVALAKRGKSVILWEADLEAPGLLEMPFFAGLREKAKGGVIDLLADTESDAGRALERYLLVHPKFEQARLRILPAGKPGGDYAKRYNRVRWDDLFGGESTLGSHRFEQIRAGLDSFQPDFVLVDSRTGITDIGGICTVQLPDAGVSSGAAGCRRIAGHLRGAGEHGAAEEDSERAAEAAAGGDDDSGRVSRADRGADAGRGGVGEGG